MVSTWLAWDRCLAVPVGCPPPQTRPQWGVKLLSGAHGARHGLLFCQGGHTLLERAGEWCSHFTARGGNRVKAKFSSDITVTRFWIIRGSLYSAFFHLPRGVIWIRYSRHCFSEAGRCPEDSLLATGDGLLRVPSHCRSGSLTKYQLPRGISQSPAIL